MKYRLLSKEQFEELHQEFSTFLAAQKMDKDSWDRIKEKEPKKVISQLEKFSDLVWEEVLNKTNYLEHYSKDRINLFNCQTNKMQRLVVRIDKKDINLQEKEGFDWFINHSNDKSISYFKGKKDYFPNRNKELFKLIEQGAVLADGTLYKAIEKIINPITD
jgi:hypothetical protein